MATDIPGLRQGSSTNSNIFDVKNSGKSYGWLGDLALGKTGKDFFHNRMDAPILDDRYSDISSGVGHIGDEYTSRFDSLGRGMQRRQAAQVDIDQDPQNQFRQGQQALASMLMAGAQGKQPSVAEMQLRQGMQQAVANANSQAAGATSANRALALKQAMNTASNLGQQVNAQAAQMRAGEMAQDRQALGAALQSARGQDIGLASDQAHMNLQSALQQRAMNDQMTQYYMNQGFSRDQAQQQAAAQLAQINLQKEQAQAEIAMANQKIEAENKQRPFKILGAVAEKMFPGGGK